MGLKSNITEINPLVKKTFRDKNIHSLKKTSKYSFKLGGINFKRRMKVNFVYNYHYDVFDVKRTSE